MAYLSQKYVGGLVAACLGVLLCAISLQGSAHGVLVSAEAIATAGGNGAVPTVATLVNCAASAVGGATLYTPANTFIMVMCDYATPAQITACSAAVAAIRGVEASGNPVLNPLPTVSYDATSQISTAATFAISVAQIATIEGVAGLGMSLVFADAGGTAQIAGNNRILMEEPIGGVYSLLVYANSSVEFPVVILPVNTNDQSAVNPCGAGGSLNDGTTSAAVLTNLNAVAPSFRFLAIVLGPATFPTSTAVTCGFPATQGFMPANSPANFDNGGTLCTNVLFGATSENGLEPSSFYNAYFQEASDTTNEPTDPVAGVTRQNELDIGVIMPASGVEMMSTNLAAAVACVADTDAENPSILTPAYGTTNIFIVACSFSAVANLAATGAQCREALMAVDGAIGDSRYLFLGFVLDFAVNADTNSIALQLAYAASAMHGTGAAGLYLVIDNPSTEASENLASFGKTYTYLRTLYRPSGNTMFRTFISLAYPDCGPGGNFAGNSTVNVSSMCSPSATADRRVQCTTVNAFPFRLPVGACGFSGTALSGWTVLGSNPTRTSVMVNNAAVQCSAAAVTQAFLGQALAFPAVTSTILAEFSLGRIGGIITAANTGTAANAMCLWNEAGLDADYAVVDCGQLPNDSAVSTCNTAIGVVATQGGNSSSSPTSIYVRVTVNSSLDVLNLAQSVASVVTQNNLTGVILIPSVLTTANSSANIFSAIQLPGSLNDQLSSRSNNPVIVAIQVTRAQCTGPSGNLFEANTSQTLRARLAVLSAPNLFFVLNFQGSFNAGGLTQQCGFTTNEVTYEVPNTRTFTGDCSGVATDTFTALSTDPMRPGPTPSNNTGGGGGGGGGSAGLGSLALLAALVASLVAFVL